MNLAYRIATLFFLNAPSASPWCKVSNLYMSGSSVSFTLTSDITGEIQVTSDMISKGIDRILTDYPDMLSDLQGASDLSPTDIDLTVQISVLGDLYY